MNLSPSMKRRTYTGSNSLAAVGDSVVVQLPSGKFNGTVLWVGMDEEDDEDPCFEYLVQLSCILAPVIVPQEFVVRVIKNALGKANSDAKLPLGGEAIMG